MIVAVVPAYNESYNIKKTLNRLVSNVDKIIVINDGSTDTTLNILRSLAKDLPIVILNHKKNLGQGKALISGFRYAIKTNANAIITFDADGQHDPQYLPFLIKYFNKGYEFVVGSRFLGTSQKMPFYRMIGIKFFSILTSILTRKRITDITSGYRLISSSLLRRMMLTQVQYSSPELYIQAIAFSDKVKEVPIQTKTRKFGKSNKGKILFAFGLFRTICVTFFRFFVIKKKSLISRNSKI